MIQKADTLGTFQIETGAYVDTAADQAANLL